MMYFSFAVLLIVATSAFALPQTYTSTDSILTTAVEAATTAADTGAEAAAAAATAAPTRGGGEGGPYGHYMLGPDCPLGLDRMYAHPGYDGGYPGFPTGGASPLAANTDILTTQGTTYVPTAAETAADLAAAEDTAAATEDTALATAATSSETTTSTLYSKI